MFSRQVLKKVGLCSGVRLQPSLSPTIGKVGNVASIHFSCGHTLKLNLRASRLIKSNRSAFSLEFIARSQSTSTISNESSALLDPIPDAPTPLAEVVQSAAESLAGEPSFASLGLGGYWPPGWVQTALEFLHVDCGLPWWGAIVCGTLVIRMVMLPIVIISQRNVAKLNNNMPQMQYLQLKVTEARQRGDKIEAARATNDMMRFMQDKDVNPLKNMLVPLCQAPVFLSVFMGLRRMANLPVESMRTGGMWWFVDLTVPDQFYLLPLITSGTLYCTMKLGVDGGMPSQNFVIMRYVMMGLPVIMFPFITGFPGAMLVYWTTSNFISLVQVGVLRLPKVREYLKIEKRVEFKKEKMPLQEKGFVNSVKDAWTNMKITSELQQRERVDKMAFMRAGRDPIVKTYKHDPTQLRQKSSSAIQPKKPL